MKQYSSVFVACLLFLIPGFVAAQEPESIQQDGPTLQERTRGRILLDVEQHGEAWYVHPEKEQRYYLGTPDDAFSVMRRLGLGVTNADLTKIPKGRLGTQVTIEEENNAIRTRLAGRILIQTEKHGEAWYVSPTDLHRYYLGRPDDALDIMGKLGLGIANETLRSIGLAEDWISSDSPKARIDDFAFSSPEGTFQVVSIAMPKATYQMVTDTAEDAGCLYNCKAHYLRAFVEQNNAELGVTGTYFCPGVESRCLGQENRFASPVYDTGVKRLVNEEQLSQHPGPLLTYDTYGRFKFFHRAAHMGNSAREYYDRFGVGLKAAVANYPSLLEDGEMVIHREQQDATHYTKTTRVGLGIGESSSSTINIVVVKQATAEELAIVMKQLGVYNALNLDGGSTTAVYTQGDYVIGPGRQVPNAVLFKRK